MSDLQQSYVRLPGHGRRSGLGFSLAGRSGSLWLGTDHLLSIERTDFTETYKRYLYRDIQAIITRRTTHGLAWSIVLGGLAGATILLGLTIGGPSWFGFGPATAALLLGLLVNVLLGPTCVCHIRTAVQTDELPSLKRLRTARRALARLRPRIEAAQSDIVPEAATAAESARRAEPVAPFNPRFHKLLCWTLLAFAAVTFVDIFHEQVAIQLVLTLLIGVWALAVVGALVNQHQAELDGGLVVVTWVAAAMLTFVFMVGSVMTMALTIQNPDAANDNWEILKLAAETRERDSPLLLGLAIFTVVITGMLGGFGLTLLRGGRKGAAVAPPPLPPPATSSGQDTPAASVPPLPAAPEAKQE